MIAIVGLIASLISIFVFLTGAGSLPGLVKRPQPVQQTPIARPIKPAPKSTSPGDAVVAPIKNSVNWAAGRLKPRKHSEPSAPNPMTDPSPH